MFNCPHVWHQSDWLSPSAIFVSSPGMTLTLRAYWGGMTVPWLPNCEPGGSFFNLQQMEGSVRQSERWQSDVKQNDLKGKYMELNKKKDPLHNKTLFISSFLPNSTKSFTSTSTWLLHLSLHPSHIKTSQTSQRWLQSVDQMICWHLFNSFKECFAYMVHFTVVLRHLQHK